MEGDSSGLVLVDVGPEVGQDRVGRLDEPRPETELVGEGTG